MQNSENESEDGRIFNVLQIAALSTVTTGCAFIGYSAAGAPLGASLMAGFATGPCLTMAIALAVTWIKEKAPRPRFSLPRSQSQRAVSNGPPLVQGPISTIEELWNSDRMLEMEYARKQNSAADGLRPRRATPEELVAMWEHDAASDAASGKALPHRSAHADLAQTPEDASYYGEKRRAARR